MTIRDKPQGEFAEMLRRGGDIRIKGLVEEEEFHFGAGPQWLTRLPPMAHSRPRLEYQATVARMPAGGEAEQCRPTARVRLKSNTYSVKMLRSRNELKGRSATYQKAGDVTRVAKELRRRQRDSRNGFDAKFFGESIQVVSEGKRFVVCKIEGLPLDRAGFGIQQGHILPDDIADVTVGLVEFSLAAVEEPPPLD